MSVWFVQEQEPRIPVRGAIFKENILAWHQNIDEWYFKFKIYSV